MTTAFVLSGGGSLGAVQVGMLQALGERDIEPDLLIGTSVGALNAAYVANHGMGDDALARLARTWAGLRRRDIFPLQPLRIGAAALGRAPSLCSPEPVRELIRRHLRIDRLEDAPIPLQVIAADVRSGCEVALGTGDAIDAVLASSAIPAVFPAVTVGSRDLVDGSIADNAAISQALAGGAERIYVLPTGYACALDEAPATPLASALQALTLLVEQRLISDVARYRDRADIRVLPPLCPLSVSSVDFRAGARLVDRARAAAGAWLDSPPPSHPEAILALHDHAHSSDPRPPTPTGGPPS